MFDFKTYIIKQFAKVKVVHSIPGRLRLKVCKSVDIPEQFRGYDKFVVVGVKLLNGIKDINFNYLLGTIVLTYDVEQTYEEKILKWIDKIIEVVIKNLNLIEQYGESNLDYVIKTIETQLKEEVRRFN